ncbi:MAG: D,D-dipeptide ABC transporter permease, partial [Acidobacteriota bacterium]
MSKNIAVQSPSVFADSRDEARRAGSDRLRKILTLVRQNPLGTFGLIIIVTFVIMAVFAPLIAPYDPKDFRAGNPDEGISGSHIFGTEQIGRDIFTRFVYGGRISLSVAFISVIGGASIGLLIGIVSGYFGGAIDSVI